MRVTAFARGTRDAAELVARYTVSNLTDRPQSLQLVLAVRPFQVNPPTQFLNLAGGVSPIRSLDWDGTRSRSTAQAKVVPLAAPDRFAASALRCRQLSRQAARSRRRRRQSRHGRTGFASAALVYDWSWRRGKAAR